VKDGALVLAFGAVLVYALAVVLVFAIFYQIGLKHLSAKLDKLAILIEFGKPTDPVHATVSSGFVHKCFGFFALALITVLSIGMMTLDR